MASSSSTTKTVLITGSTRGIGLKFAEFYIALGWNVIGAARDPAKADQLKALSPYKIVQLDSTDETSVKNAAATLAGEAIDLLINNAGIFSGADLTSTTKADLMGQFEVNSVGPFLVTRAFVPHLKAAVAKNGSANVAQISSRMGSITLNSGGSYGYRASKTAVNMINASLAMDLKADQIGAFVLHPGYVITDLTGHKGDVTTETSVQGLMDVISKFALADTGKFYNYTGEGLPCAAKSEGVLNWVVDTLRFAKLQAHFLKHRQKQTTKRDLTDIERSEMAGKTVLVTGATRGIGLKFVELYGKLGWKVIGAARDPAKADQLKSLAPYKVVHLDASDEASILNAAQELEGEAIDLLINNAGVFAGGSLDVTTKEDLLQQFEVNAVGPFLVTRVFLPHLKRAVATNGSALVAQITSFLGSVELTFRELSGFSAGGRYGYRASKAALNMVTASLAVDLKSERIGTLVLHPGFVQTDLTDHHGEITAEESVSGLMKVITGFEIKHSGAFVDWTGAKMPW